MSSEGARKFYNRSPRYVLQMKDNSVVRFASFPKDSKKFKTRLINISETGMAFLLPFLDNPKMNEVIKIEFEAPGADPIACFARVRRIEDHHLYTSDAEKHRYKLVAVEFMDLPLAQAKNIREGLRDEFKRIRALQKREQILFRLQWLAVRSINTVGAAVSWPKNIIKKLSQGSKKKKPEVTRYSDKD